MEMFAMAAVVLVAVVLGGWLALRAKARRERSSAGNLDGGKSLSPVMRGKRGLVTEEDALERPSRIVVNQGDEEVMSMMVLDEADFPTRSQRASKVNANAFSRALEPIMQVAPSLATAAMAGSRQLMEVAINGNLIAAADGNGFRAIAMGAGGIKEHARLFEPKNLQNVANATAIWQLASVAVAQKHLADISATLKRVETKVDAIQSFMDEQRLAVIHSVMHYLDDARRALSRSEFLERTRNELEHFDIELDKASMSLFGQIRRESEIALEEDMVGCEGEYESALRKHRRVGQYVDELTLCNEVRLANWYVCSLYPDRSEMLGSRLGKIRKAISDTDELQTTLEYAMDRDCTKIDSPYTSDATIAQRRREVRETSSAKAFQESKSRCEQVVLRMGAVAADRKKPQRMIIESRDGKPSAVYLCHDQATDFGLNMPPIKEGIRRGSSSFMH